MKTLWALLDALSFLTIVPVPSSGGVGDPAQRMGRAVTWRSEMVRPPLAAATTQRLQVVRPPLAAATTQRLQVVRPPLAAATTWFPLVGGFIGWIGGSVLWLAASVWPLSVAALLSVGAMALLTGGLHLDGFADTVDGLGARGGREAILAVMRDSRIGAFGVIGLFLLLGLKWALIQSLPSDQWIPALVVSCALSRWALVISGCAFPYVPGREGLGRLVTDQKATGAVVRATILAVAILLAGTRHWSGLLGLGAAGLMVWALNSLFVIRLGGITGDTLGAVNEFVELSVLLFLVTR